MVRCLRPLTPLITLLVAGGVHAQAPVARGKAPKVEAASEPGHLKALERLKFREIGPTTMGGRIGDLAVVESNPSTVYMGTASGGIFRTLNAGTTWSPVFAKEEVSTIGDMALAPSDPMILWVGTGEANNRQSSSWGNGVYKSTDGGITWKHMGLRETQAIGRILIHPTQPDTVYVAAVGSLWGPGKDRGLYKTTDGGLTWKQVLQVSEHTGITEVVMDPGSPHVLYAAAYQRRRTVFGFNGSGPESMLYKSTDGGATWKKLEVGLPWDPKPAPTRPTGAAGGPPPEVAAMFGLTAPPAAPSETPKLEEAARTETGRMGLAVYRRDPRILYALVEHAQGGIFRSEDRGETWKRMSDTNPRPMYYSKVIIDPNNDQRIWVLGAQLFYSEDGGKTFSTEFGGRIHGDHHALWINPANSDHMIMAGDGGIEWSWDRGRTWDFVNNVPLGQFYEVGVDMRQPYWIYGGLQDNNTWGGPSMSFNPRGISSEQWVTVGGGDGFYAQVDPTDPNTVYAESQDGNLLRRDMVTGEQRSIRPMPGEGEPAYRFQWNSPILISAFDAKTIYYGGNFVFRSPDRGDSWVKVSPDLTGGVDRNTLAIMGKVPDKYTRSRHDGVQNWPAITSLAESPLDAKVLWAGTDDGHLQVTRDGGQTWKNVMEKVPGVPKGTYVSRVIASRSGAGSAYVTFDGHRNGDFAIYAYATTDFGESWKRITQGIPETKGVLNVIREHPKNPALLLAGGEQGLYASFNRGERWMPLKLNLPTVPVDDICIHPRDNDLILGTHGRSLWVLDDMAPLAELNEQVLASPVHLFTPRPAIQWRLWANSGSTGNKVFFGENPPQGAIFNVYLKEKPAEGASVRLAIQDKEGRTLRNLTVPGEPGIHRVVWDTRLEVPGMPSARAGEGRGGGGMGAFGGGGPRVEPGEYLVKVTAGSATASGTVKVLEDPRIVLSAEDRVARGALVQRLMPKLGPITLATRTLTQHRTALVAEMEGWKRPGTRVAEPVQKAAEALLKKVDELYPSFGTPPSEARGLGDAGPALVERPTPIPQRLQRLYGAVANQNSRPTAWQVQEADLLLSKVDDLAGSVRKLYEELGALNKLMNDSGVPHIQVQLEGMAGGRRRQEEGLSER